MSLETNDAQHRNFLRARDLLVIVIISLGATIILRWTSASVLAGAGDGALWQVATILVSLGLPYLSVLGAVYLVALRWRGLSWFDLGLRPAVAFWYARAIYLGIAAYLLIAMASALVGQLLGGLPVNPQIKQLVPSGITLWGSLTMALMVCLVAPFIEEILFRGILYAWLRRRWGIVVSSLVSGICFSLLHGIPWLIPAIAVLGVLLAVIYEKSGSLWPSIVAHAIFNSVTVILLYTILAQGAVLH
jgi:membrane protease YdiL (CAAX protease family)